MGIINVFSKNERDKNRSHIRNLLEAAISDGILDNREYELIVNIAGKYDISRDEVISIRDNPQSVKFSPPSSYSAKVKLLEDLIMVILADKKIDEEELRLCKDLAKRLNLNPVIVEDMIMALANK